MLPYGVIIRENRLTMQQAFLVWQKKFGILNAKKFISSSALPLLFLTVVYFVGTMLLDKKPAAEIALYSAIIYGIFLGIFMYTSAMKTVRDFSVSAKERRVQLVLKEETVEIVTDFSKEIIYYDEIELCYEKNFLVTLIFDKGNFPLSISKVNFEKGDYDIFVSLLKSKIPGKYEKRGEN